MAGRICATASSVVSGRMPSSAAMVTSRVPIALVALSATPMTVVIGTISSLNLPAACARRCAQWAAHAVLILRFLGNVISLGHLFGGLQHVPVQRRLVLNEPGIAAHVRVGFVLHAGDALDAPGDDHRHSLGHD